ncbi:sulfotransferase domain-containing protein [Microbacterium schleiferi]|uniref:sulfotransferase domain-containing protein n=1 Tax=Microbacterium schleiferi TaxID=69362 RepID=UPI001D174AD7|nr:sulfotransferase domain-containing protein [Microbacterium schleiferi]MCC4266752.1 sulfotransferase domain-containing protein [Microbacterium schleiferi]
MTLDFFIIGAQKAATSSLQAALSAVPDVFLPVGESPFFEDPDYASKPWLSFPGKGVRQRVAGIKRPDALCRSDIINRVASACPDVKLIVVLREPISRAVSAYYHLARHAHVPAEGLNAGLRRSLEDFDRGVKSQSRSLITYGQYGKYLGAWHERFPSERFLVLSQSFVRRDLAGALAACCAHLGVDNPGHGLPSTIADRNVGLYDDRFIAMYAAGHRLKTQAVPDSTRRLPANSRLRRAAGNAITRSAELLADHGRRPAELEPDIAQYLSDIYSADRALLDRVAPASAVDWDFS